MRTIAKELGVPRKTVERHIQTAADFDDLPPAIQSKVEAGDVSVAVAKQAVKAVTPKGRTNGREPDSALPPEALKIFDEEADKRKKVNGLMTFLERTASGFAHHESLALGRRWSKADSDILRRHVAAIHKHVSAWRKKL